jgi:SP family general alpha glucoside:H+ symporter-like MFS transporter
MATEKPQALAKYESNVVQEEKVEAIGHLTNQEDHQEGIIEGIKKRPLAFLWCVYAIWVILLTSFDNQAAGTVLGIPAFRKDFGTPYQGDYVLPAKWQSAYSGAPVASAVIGSLGTGYLADIIGRKYMFALTYVFCFVGITLEVVATTNEIFFAGKFIAGFAIGGFITTSMTYIGEVAPLALRGVLTAASAIAFTLGPFIVSLIVNSTGNQDSRWAYRTVFVCQYGFSGAGALGLIFMPESPWYLINHGYEEKAIRSLHRLGYKEDETTKRMAVIKTTLDEIKQETDGVTYLECFRKSNLRRTIISVAPLSIQALCGVFFVAAYSTYYQQLAGYSTKASFHLAIVQQVLSMLGNITSWFLIDRVGRRDLTFWGMFFLTVLLFVTGGLAVAATPGAIKGTVALMLVYCYAYNVTIGATAYSLLTEVATSRLRAKTASLALALQNSLFVGPLPSPIYVHNILTPPFADHVGLRDPLPLQPELP